MNQSKTFTIEEARSLIPKLKEMLVAANDQLGELAKKVEDEAIRYQAIEGKLAEVKSNCDDATEIAQLRTMREEFQKAIEDLSKAKQEYIGCLTNWVDRISDTGVLLRDISSGLLDFPAKQGKQDYYLCWRLNEPDIDYWHLANDGFIGRRPLAVLAEYF